MNEDQLGWIGQLQPFGTAEAAQWEVRRGRCAALGSALWGRTAEDLRRQLEKPHPDLPSGFELADFQVLLVETSRVASLNLDDPHNAWVRRLLHAGSIRIGTQELTEWEARVEIVRRAIDSLQNH